MRKIPPDLREEMARDPYYKRCAVTGATTEKIEWHHALIFAGKQVSEKFCIIPLSKTVHDQIHKYKERIDWIIWNRASESQLKFYSRAVNYKALKERLNQKYGVYKGV